MRAGAGRWARRRTALVVATVLSAGSLVVLTPVPAAADQPPQFVDEWGTVAAADADLRDPVSVAIGPTRELYVLDTTRDRLLVFGTDGTLLRSWADNSSTRITVAPTTGNLWSIAQCEVKERTPDGTLVRSLNAIAGGCLFQNGLDLAVAPSGDVYVLENLLTWQTETPRVRVYSGATGRQVRSWTGASSGAGALTDPSAIAVAADGNVYVADPIRDDVQEFTPTGSFVRSWGSTGTGPGQFRYARDLAVAGDGSVSVADASIGRIQRFDPAGNLLGAFGRAGTEPGAMTDPDDTSVENLDLALDPVNGDVVVADTSNRRVQRYSVSGTFLGLRGYFETEGRVVQPFDVATDAAGNVYVTETRAQRVEVFDPAGQFLRTWRRADNADGSLREPRGIVVDVSVFVADAGHGRIQRYAGDGTQVAAFGEAGSGPGQLDRPTYLALDGSGLLYVGDAGNDRVSVFTTDGTFVRSFGTRGTGDGQFKGVAGIAVGDDGNVYVGDNNSTSGGARTPRIQRLSPTGTFLGRWGAAGTAEGQFATITDLATNAAGRLYVADCGSVDRVQVFDLTGTALTSWGVGDGGFAGCDSGLALSGRSVYLATDRTTNGSEDDRIVRYEYPTGGLMSATITVDETDVMAGTTVHYHVTVNNLGGVPLTDVVTTDSADSSCSRSVPDVAVGDRYRFDCTYEVTAADSGWFPNELTVTSAEAPTVTSDPARVDVSAFGPPVVARTWWPSATGADDAPITGFSPGGLAADADGHVHVVGSRPAPRTSVVQRFDTDANLETAWGATGAGPGQLREPQSVAPAPDGTVYTTECGANRLSHFTADGQLISYWLEQRFPGGRQVCSPSDVTVGPDGHVYTADAANDRIEHLVGNDLVPLVGSTGTGDGQFQQPTELAVGPDGTLYVLDLGNDRIQRFAADGTFLSSFGGQGDHNGQLRNPTDLAIDGAGRVYVADTTRDLVQVYTPEGRYLARWTAETANLAAQTEPDGTVLVHTTLTTSDGPLTGAIRTYAFAPDALVTALLTPTASQVDPGRTASFSLRLDNLGSVTVTGLTVDAGILSGCGGATADLAPGTSRTLTCTYVPSEAEAGELHARATVDSDQTAPEPSNTAWVEVRLRKVQRWGSAGAGPGRFADPDGVAARAGRVYVADCGNDRVQEFDRDTEFVRAWGGSGAAEGQFECPTDLTIASNGHVLVVDSGNGRVQEFTADGVFVRAWSTQTPSGGVPHAIDVDDDDNVYVVDWNNSSNTGGRNTVRRFTPTGSLVTTFPNAGNRYRPTGLWVTSAGVLHLVGAGATMDTYDLDGAYLGALTVDSAHDVALDLQGHLWTTVPTLNQVQKRSATGRVLGRWTVPGATGITISAGEVYVTTTTDRVVKLGVRDPGTGISGRITEDGSGEPIAGAAVLALRRDDYTLLAAANADANGDYQLDLAPGDYAIEFADPSGAHGYEWYDDRPGPEGITTVHVDAGARTVVSGSLAPARGAVAGTVTELDGGAPVDGVTVLALRTGASAASSGAVGARAVTDAAGRYRLTGLDPGDYLVAVVDLANRFATPDVVPVTIAGGGTAVADAAVEPLPPRIGAITGTVRATTTVSGTPTTAPVPGALVVALDPADLRLVAAAATDNTGAYELQVPSGDVLVAFVDPLGRHTFEWFDDQTAPASFDDVARVQAGDTADATLVRTTGDLTGSVSGTDTTGVAVLAVRPTGIAGATLTDGAGRYTIAHLPPTTYLLVYIDPTGNYRANFYRNQSLTTLASRVTVTAGVRSNLSSQTMEAW